MSLNVGILYYNAVFRGLPRRPWDPFTWLAARAPRKACKSWAAQNLAIYAQIGEQRSVLESEPFACCMSKSERIARQGRCARLEGRRTGRRGRPPNRLVNGARNKANDIISSSDLFDPARVSPSSVRSPASFTLRCPLPLSGPSLSCRLSASPLLFPTPANAQHVVCPERQRKGKWKAAEA